MKHFDSDEKQKVSFTYPCEWVYKVIGYQEKAIRKAISEIITDKPFEVSFSNRSSTKKYISLNLDLMLENETERETIYMALKIHPAIKMVL
jgi:putative lipoic acid-binding regulatory protein